MRLSVHLNCAKNSYSLPNLQEISQQEFTGTASSNCSTDDERSHNTSPNLPKSDNEEDTALAEFETKHFPADINSSRSSLADDISISSLMDMTLTQTSPSTIPEINIDDVSITEPSSNEVKKIKVAKKSISSRLTVALYKEPFWLLLLVVLTAIPMAILLQMTNIKY